MNTPQLHGNTGITLSPRQSAARLAVTSSTPASISPRYRPADRLAGRVAIVTGSASGLSRSVAVGFAAEGAAVVIAHTAGLRHAMDTRDMLSDYGASCSVFPSDPADPDTRDDLVRHTIREFGRLDVLVNIPCCAHIVGDIEDITDAQFEDAFHAGVFPMLRLTRAALPHLKKSRAATIINTTAAPMGAAGLGYDAANGAIVSASRALSAQLADHGVRVNAVVPASDDQHEPPARSRMPRPAPRACAPAEHIGTYVFLASDDSSPMTGQVLRLDGAASTNC